MNIKKTILPAVDAGLAATSAGMDLIGRVTPWGYAQVPEFSIDGSPVCHFIHRYNAFYPPYRMTERTVELALADIFLRANRGRHIVEIGAVTPYYWPDRVQPTDETILSISTFEHIGSGEYGLAPDAAATQQAIDKLLGCGCDFLMTYPAGYNPALDAYMRSTVHRGSDYRVMAWHRGPRGNDWRQVEFSEVTPAMETYMPGWAQTLVVLYRGPADIWSRPELRDNI